NTAMHYQYSAKTNTGATVEGLVNAASLGDATRQLRQRDLFLVSARPAGRECSETGAALPRRRGGRHVGKRDLMALTSQLAIMARSGVDLATALGDVARECQNPTLRSALERVHEEVLSGRSITAALGTCEHIFGQSYVASVAAAEAAGRLPEVLGRLAALLRSELRMLATVRSLLAYPVLLATVSSLVVLALVFFVLPQFAAVFDQLDLTLPLITRILVGTANEIRGRIWLWGPLGLGAAGAAFTFAISPAGHRTLDRFLLGFVLVRDVTQALLIGRSFRLLGTMIESGVPLQTGLRLTRSSFRNSLLQSLFRTLEDDVVNGRGLSASLMTSSFVPSAAAQMVATAERTGTLALVTQQIGEYYEEEGETRLRELAGVLEPLMIIIMGGVVGLVVMSVMLPIFDFATAAK
ncbi:MAG: type II secretion system F family protein, partial [Thermoguttaceae bacterium]